MANIKLEHYRFTLPQKTHRFGCVFGLFAYFLPKSLTQKLKLQGGTIGAIQIATKAVRKYGTYQITGVYGGNYNNFPLGTFIARNITLKMGQAPVIHLMPELFQMIMEQKFDPTEIITHRLPLTDASHGYKIFNDRDDNCIKVIQKP